MRKNNEDKDHPKIIELLEKIEDPRLQRCQKHPLMSVIFVAIAGALCGADDWVHIEAIGNALKDWITTFVPLPNGISIGQLKVDDKSLDKDHGRIEKRTYSVIDAEDLSLKTKWAGIQSLGKVTRERNLGVKTEIETIYYVMSIEIDAKLFEKCSRGHWHVENSLHWCLDVVFREDDSRYRNRIGAQNLSAIR